MHWNLPSCASHTIPLQYMYSSLGPLYFNNDSTHEQFTIWYYFHKKALVLQEKAICLSRFSRNTDILSLKTDHKREADSSQVQLLLAQISSMFLSQAWVENKWDIVVALAEKLFSKFLHAVQILLAGRVVCTVMYWRHLNKESYMGVTLCTIRMIWPSS